MKREDNGNSIPNKTPVNYNINDGSCTKPHDTTIEGFPKSNDNVH